MIVVVKTSGERFPGQVPTCAVLAGGTPQALRPEEPEFRVLRRLRAETKQIRVLPPEVPAQTFPVVGV